MLDDDIKYQLSSHIAKFDHLAISLMPTNIQKSIYVLYSFFAELDGLASQVSEPMLGEIRCQWWRDVITDKQAQSPLAEALLEAMAKHTWPEQALLDLIDAKIFDLYADPMDNKASFEAYAGHTYSTLLQLTAQAIDPMAAKQFADVSGHLGVAFTVAKSLTYLKVHQSRGQIFIPNDILKSIEVSDVESLKKFIQFGLDHYALAKQHLTDKVLFPASLPLIRAKLILSNAHKLGDDIYKKLETISPSQLSFQWDLMKANIFKKI